MPFVLLIFCFFSFSPTGLDFTHTNMSVKWVSADHMKTAWITMSWATSMLKIIWKAPHSLRIGTLYVSPPRVLLVFALLYSAQQCGPRFWCQSKVGGKGRGGQKGRLWAHSWGMWVWTPAKGICDPYVPLGERRQNASRRLGPCQDTDACEDMEFTLFAVFLFLHSRLQINLYFHVLIYRIKDI